MRSGRVLAVVRRHSGQRTLMKPPFALIAPDDRPRIARTAARAWEAKRLLHALPLADLLEFV
jgi:hypothetical protein